MLRRVGMLLIVLLMAVGGACAAGRDDAPAYPVFEWERDAVNHWRLQSDGTKSAVQAHDVDEDTMICSVCGTEVWLFDDGSVDLNNYSDQGELLRYTSFNEAGEIMNDGAFVYVLAEDGGKMHEYQFGNGRFVAQTAYAMGEDGANHPAWSETYYDDGIWARNEYDAYGNCIKAYTYDENDVLTAEITSEYARNEEGWFYEAKSTTNMDGTVFISEYNAYGDKTYSCIFDPDAGTLFETRRVYEYRRGQKVHSKQYEGDVLVMETFHNEDGSTTKEIEYLEDGTTIVYEYDENGGLIGE
nr:hypothetical protein [Clostridia bacterium]